MSVRVCVSVELPESVDGRVSVDGPWMVSVVVIPAGRGRQRVRLGLAVEVSTSVEAMLVGRASYVLSEEPPELTRPSVP